MVKRLLAAMLVFAWAIPMALTVSLSFFSYYRYPQIIPSHFSLDGWARLFNNSNLLRAAFQGGAVAAVGAMCSTAMGFLAARALTRHIKKKTRFIRIFLSLPLFIPATALFIGVQQIITRLGAANTFLGVVLAHLLLQLPYSFNIGFSFFEGIPYEMEEMARTLGLNPFQVFARVVLPLLLPAMALSLSIGFLISYSEYFATALIGGGEIWSLAAMLYPILSNADIQGGSALSILFVLVNLLVFFLAGCLVRRMNDITYLYQ